MKYLCVIGSFILLIFIGCRQELARTEIDVPDSVKKAIEEAAPASKYRFCVLKDSLPKLYEDLKRFDLYVCGGIDNRVGLEVAMAPLTESQTLLFGRIRRFFINPNIIAGALSMTDFTKITPDSGGVFVIPCEQTIYGKDHAFENVLGECLGEMENTKAGVLLLERNKSLDDETLKKIVEIGFR